MRFLIRLVRRFIKEMKADVMIGKRVYFYSRETKFEGIVIDITDDYFYVVEDDEGWGHFKNKEELEEIPNVV